MSQRQARRGNRRVTVAAPPTGVAVVGCGYWGVNYVRVFSELPDADVVVACDAQPARRNDVRRRFLRVRVEASLQAALEDPAVAAVVIATPATSHFADASAAIAAGKHVLVEKPLTTRSRDAERLVESAQAMGVTLMVGHTFLYNPGVGSIETSISRGDLGDVYYLYSRRTNLGPFRTDVNAIWDLASHDVAVFNHLLGATPEWVSAVGARVLRNAREDVGFVSLGYPGGIVAHIHASWADPNKVRELVVVGSDKRAVFNDLDPVERVRIFEKSVRTEPDPDELAFGDYHFVVRDGAIVSPVVAPTEPLKAQCGHFLHCIRRNERSRTPGETGVDVVRVLEAIDRSVARRGVPVSIGAGRREGRPPLRVVSTRGGGRGARAVR